MLRKKFEQQKKHGPGIKSRIRKIKNASPRSRLHDKNKISRQKRQKITRRLKLEPKRPMTQDEVIHALRINMEWQVRIIGANSYELVAEQALALSREKILGKLKMRYIDDQAEIRRVGKLVQMFTDFYYTTGSLALRELSKFRKLEGSKFLMENSMEGLEILSNHPNHEIAGIAKIALQRLESKKAEILR